MSESHSIVLFPLTQSDEHSAPADDRRREQEQELQRILRRLTTDMSALAKVKALPRAKALYEDLHPETRHGGDRSPLKQVPESGTWPSFTKHVADTCGISPSTVYSHLKWAEQLESLTPEAESEANATALANQLGILARIAALPDPAVQHDLALRFDRQRRQVKKELRDREREFGLASPSTGSRNEREPIEVEHEPEQGSGDSTACAADDAQLGGDENGLDRVSGGYSGASEETHSGDRGLAAIQTVPATSTLAERLHGGLQADTSEIEELRGRLRRAEEKCARLESHLALYEGSPLGELFTILGVTTVQDALARARGVLGVSDAAE